MGVTGKMYKSTTDESIHESFSIWLMSSTYTRMTYYGRVLEECWLCGECVDWIDFYFLLVSTNITCKITSLKVKCAISVPPFGFAKKKKKLRYNNGQRNNRKIIAPCAQYITVFGYSAVTFCANGSSSKYNFKINNSWLINIAGCWRKKHSTSVQESSRVLLNKDISQS